MYHMRSHTYERHMRFPQPGKAFCRKYGCDGKCKYSHTTSSLEYCRSVCIDGSCPNLIHNHNEKMALITLICHGKIIVGGNIIGRLLEKILHYETLLKTELEISFNRPAPGFKLHMCGQMKCVGIFCIHAHGIYDLNICYCTSHVCDALVHSTDEYDLLYSILTGRIPGIMERIATYFNEWKKMLTPS